MDSSCITHNNHYIPQFYLKRWSNDGRSIYVYSLLVSNAKVPYWRRQAIKSTAVWNDFYTRVEGQQEVDDFEKWFDHEFESPAKPAFDKLLNGKQLDKKECLIVSRFVASQHVRTPARLNDLMALGRKEMPSLFQNVLNKASKVLGQGRKEGNHVYCSSDERKLIPMRVTLDKEQGVAKVDSIVGKGMYLFALKYLLKNTVHVMEKHTWHIVHATDGIDFPTSDDPVICLNYRNKKDYDFNGGWGRKYGDIIMPLSPKILLYTEIGNNQICTQLDYSTYWSTFFRKLIIQHAHRYVYAIRPQKGMLAINPRIVNPDLYKKEKSIMSGWHDEQMRAEQEL